MYDEFYVPRYSSTCLVKGEHREGDDFEADFNDDTIEEYSFMP